MKKITKILLPVLILAAVCAAVIVPTKFFQHYDDRILNSLNTESVSTTELYRNTSMSVEDRLQMICSYKKNKNITLTEKTENNSSELVKDAESAISMIKILQALNAFPQLELKSSDVVSVQRLTSTYTDSSQPDIYVKTAKITLLMRSGDITIVFDPDTNTIYEYTITINSSEWKDDPILSDLVGNYSTYLGIELFNVGLTKNGLTLFQSKDQTIEYKGITSDNSINLELSVLH